MVLWTDLFLHFWSYLCWVLHLLECELFGHIFALTEQRPLLAYHLHDFHDGLPIGPADLLDLLHLFFFLGCTDH